MAILSLMFPFCLVLPPSLHFAAAHASDVDCILNCDQESFQTHLQDSEAYLHLPMLVRMEEIEGCQIFLLRQRNIFFKFFFFLAVQSSKLDRFSILSNLPAAVSFAKANLGKGNRLLVCCNNGKDLYMRHCLLDSHCWIGLDK